MNNDDSCDSWYFKYINNVCKFAMTVDDLLYFSWKMYKCLLMIYESQVVIILYQQRLSVDVTVANGLK